MPTYAAKCKKCKKVFEFIARITECDKLPKCKCGGETESVPIKNLGGFILKEGIGGFYKPGGHK